MLGVAKALLHLRKAAPNPGITVDWFGGTPSGTKALEQTERFIADNGLSDALRLHPPTKTIEREYANAAAVGLFSYFEGLPNVVCEAMACGKPVLLSNVCDAGNLVKDGVNGFLCDPGSAQSMATAFTRLASSSDQEREAMGTESRRMAESLFSESLGLDRYEKILAAAAANQPVPTDCSWPPIVPESAIRSAKS